MNPVRLPDGALVHHTFYLPRYLRRYAGAVRRVVTIHDMIPEMHPEFAPLRNTHRAKRRFVAAADLIICNSESTKSDLLNVYGEQTAPVVVTHWGVSDGFAPGADKPGALPARYLLFIGKRHRYKDFSILARAFVRAALPANVKLALVGGEPLLLPERRRLARLGLTDRLVGPLRLTDRELSGAYGHALALVFPSRLEGFGMPTLEAMASGCTVILARAAAHPEVGGEAALFFEAGNSDELAEVLSEVVANERLREQRTALGLTRASSFTWSATARRTGEAYHALA